MKFESKCYVIVHGEGEDVKFFHRGAVQWTSFCWSSEFKFDSKLLIDDKSYANELLDGINQCVKDEQEMLWFKSNDSNAEKIIPTNSYIKEITVSIEI